MTNKMTNKRIEWTTPKGTAVELTLKTTETTDADGIKVETACYRLECWLPGPGRLIHNPTIITDPVCGLALRGNGIIIAITPDVADAVTTLVTEYRTEVDRRQNEWIKNEREYAAHQARMRRAGFCDDPNAE